MRGPAQACLMAFGLGGGVRWAEASAPGCWFMTMSTANQVGYRSHTPRLPPLEWARVFLAGMFEDMKCVYGVCA